MSSAFPYPHKRHLQLNPNKQTCWQPGIKMKSVENIVRMQLLLAFCAFAFAGLKLVLPSYESFLRGVREPLKGMFVQRLNHSEVALRDERCGMNSVAAQPTLRLVAGCHVAALGRVRSGRTWLAEH